MTTEKATADRREAEKASAAAEIRNIQKATEESRDRRRQEEYERRLKVRDQRWTRGVSSRGETLILRPVCVRPLPIFAEI